MKHRLLPVLLHATTCLPYKAQEVERDLPAHLAPHELSLIPAYRDSRAGGTRGISTPPPFTPRTMAEWEEVQSLVVTWRSYPPILKQIVEHARHECEVIIVCASSGEYSVSNVTSYLQADNTGGPPITDLSNITFHVASTNSVWVRDYGPENIYENEVDSLYLLDWIYNRPRPQDDALSDNLGNLKDLVVYSTTQAPNDLVHTGGNFMADGFGTAFSSDLVIEENGPQGQFNQTDKTPAQVDALMTLFMGIGAGRYVRMAPLPYDVINHIDMHMKLLDEETLLVGEFPTGVSDGPQIEQNLTNVLDNYTSVFGTPYEVVRIPMVPSTGGSYPPNASYRTYANGIFINKLVLIPTYREQYDTTGLRIWRESLPGYRVVGIDCDNSTANIISASGAIHCITKCIGVQDPLLIRHQRLRDTYDTANPYVVEAYVRHRSGIASARVWWTTDTTQAYASIDMTAGSGDNWTASIPPHPAGTEIFYYIEATANSGKTQGRPIVAPEGWWRFRVLGGPTGIADPDGPQVIAAYPNPTSGLLVIEVGGAGQERVRASITDAIGRPVMLLQDAPMHADRRLFADLGGLAEGTYLVVVENSSGRTVHRVVKH